MVRYEVFLHLGIVLYFDLCHAGKLGMLGFQRMFLKRRRGKSVVALSVSVRKLSILRSCLKSPFLSILEQVIICLFLGVRLSLSVLYYSARTGPEFLRTLD